ncbi:hypothetical protein [Dictyobacter alpinus]|uniref:hypothetical protein n=1 Tax=Dictyobacter alpinus TaxID=2014873 RepID=UPI000F83BD52|nr:hypothetical protein [Dictyobacter alpinus]
MEEQDEKSLEPSKIVKVLLISLMQAGSPWHKAATIAGLQISRSTAYRLLQAGRKTWSPSQAARSRSPVVACRLSRQSTDTMRIGIEEQTGQAEAQKEEAPHHFSLSSPAFLLFRSMSQLSHCYGHNLQ